MRLAKREAVSAKEVFNSLTGFKKNAVKKKKEKEKAALKKLLSNKTACPAESVIYINYLTQWRFYPGGFAIKPHGRSPPEWPT
jgi:hypothetical protein